MHTINGLYRIYLVNINHVLHPKHVVFEERIFSIRTFKSSIVPDEFIEVHHEHCASENVSRIILPLVDQAMQESEYDSCSMVQAREETGIEAAHDEREPGDLSDL